MNILEVENLKIWDIRNDEVLVKEISFSVRKGKCLAIVGESGSGKSMSIKSVNRIHEPWIITEGNIRLNGTELTSLTESEMGDYRGNKIFVIFQEAMSSCDPSMKIKNYVTEIVKINCNMNKKEAYDNMICSMEKVKLNNPHEIMTKYPHQLSGGMLQRIIIALAFTIKPELIIADEPTTALDTITQYEVVDEFKRLVDEEGVSMIFISHDLGVVKKLADDIVVMKNGEIVERGSNYHIFSNAKEEYTKYLINTRKALGDNYRKYIGEAYDAGSKERYKII